VTNIKKNDLSDFEEREISIRGTTFKIRELSAEEYDNCLKGATKPDGDIDTVLLLRLMAMKSLKDPSLSAEEINALPYKVSRRLSTAVNELHFGDDDEGE
jgi:hypothetical protein